MPMEILFVELHEGEVERPQAVQIAVEDIRMVRATTDGDRNYLSQSVRNYQAFQACIIFKGDAWRFFVHEPPHEVYGLCGFKISR